MKKENLMLKPNYIKIENMFGWLVIPYGTGCCLYWMLYFM